MRNEDPHERRRGSASLDLRRESLQQESAFCDDSHWPSIPASRGPSPAARVPIPRRERTKIGVTAAGQLHALFACVENPRASDAEIAWYRAHLPHAAGTSLELMCGNGRLLAPLIEAGVNVHGVDASAA